MQVTVFGASGKVGRLVADELLQHGYDVVAVVHRHHPFGSKPHLTVVEGDVARREDVDRALQGSEAVLCCLGSWGQPGRNVLTVGMGTIIPAMEALGITRIVSLTGHGADAPDIVSSMPHKLMMKMLSPFPAGTVFRDGEVHMHMLAASSLDWTALRSPLMKSRGRNSYVLTERPGFPLKVIARAAVASAVVDQLTLTDYIHRSPVINLGK
ncbi:MAG TPA: NAD(P)-binding oxidoreductase [Candidatus Microsaccharimonas sp.]|nr:NAD(P)-binding oxidoreductase [Candidatus Microsaccharimonas sp.]